jgi:hypothetical protein
VIVFRVIEWVFESIRDLQVKRLHDAFHEPFRRSLHPKSAPTPLVSSPAASASQAASSREAAPGFDEGDQAAALTQLPMDDMQADNESELED